VLSQHLAAAAKHESPGVVGIGSTVR
jgi:hypothetical protein